MLSKSKPVTKGQTLYESTYVKYLEQPNLQRKKVKQWLVTKAGEEKNEVLFNSAYLTLVWEYENVLEMDTENSCTTM